MRMQLSLEIPTSKLHDWARYTDFDFALAHRVLEDEAYRQHYANRSPDRMLLLDNSFHELGEPLPAPKLAAAAAAVRASFVITPDRLEEPSWTLQQFHDMAKAYPDLPLAVVLGGESAEERSRFIAEVQGRAVMLCLPYRRSRLEWFLEQRPFFRRIHLLGVSSLQELLGWRWLVGSTRLRGIQFSVDTSKPVKWGLKGRLLDLDNRSIRHSGVSSKDLLGMDGITKEQEETIVRNILFLRELIK